MSVDTVKFSGCIRMLLGTKSSLKHFQAARSGKNAFIRKHVSVSFGFY